MQKRIFNLRYFTLFLNINFFIPVILQSSRVNITYNQLHLSSVHETSFKSSPFLLVRNESKLPVTAALHARTSIEISPIGFGQDFFFLVLIIVPHPKVQHQMERVYAGRFTYGNQREWGQEREMN